MPTRLRTAWPALVALLVALAFVGWRMAGHEFDVRGLAEVGTRYGAGVPDGTEGYDGQFALFIAMQPNPRLVAGRLDVPAYRYQRILLPILARILALGRPDAIPWTLLLVNLASLTFGTWAVADLLRRRGLTTWYALTFGLWVGVVCGVGLDLTEPLAYGLVALGWLARERGRVVLGALAMGLAVFAKETAAVFLAAAVLADGLAMVNAGVARRADGDAAARRGFVAGLGAGVAFAVWQVILWRIFGRPGLGSGGAMATPFEWVPFMGLWRIGAVKPEALWLFLGIFGPTILLPTVGAAVASIVDLARRGPRAATLALLGNAGALVFLPFSTFREPLGLVRMATGLVLGVVFFGAQDRLRRPLNYSLFWIALLALLIAR
jgi:hypothetical protein